MTNSQYIQVAEMWGWYEDSRGKLHYLWRSTSPDTGGRLFDIDELKEEINSWQGFGRTVEKLHERKLPKRLTDRYKAYYIDFLRGHLTAEIFIQGTHLVALEANLKGEQGGKTKTGAGAIRKRAGNDEAGGLDKGGCRV